MSEQFHYAWSDIKRNPATFSIFAVQILSITLLVAIMTTTIANARNYEKHLSSVSDMEQTYFLRDRTDDYKVNQMINQTGIEAEFYELYSFLHDSDQFQAYSYYDYPIYLGNYEHFPAFHVSEQFLDVFSLEVSAGDSLESADFLPGESIPILLGDSFRGQYEVGDQIGEQYVVKGFLEKDMFYLSPKATDEVLYLNDTAVVPIRFDAASDYAELHMALDQTCIITETPEDLFFIRDKSAELGLFDYHFESFASQMENILQDARDLAMLELTISGLIFLFCLINIVTVFLHFIQSHKREFAIHLLCGATARDFIGRLVWQVAIILLLTELLVFIFFFRWQVLVSMTLVNLCIGLLVLGCPVITLLRQNVSDVLKRSE